MPLRDALLQARSPLQRFPLAPAERLAWAMARHERLLSTQERLGSSQRQLARSRALLAAMDVRLGPNRVPRQPGHGAGDRGGDERDRCE